jgi:hypothetical protein
MHPMEDSPSGGTRSRLQTLLGCVPARSDFFC